MAGAVSANEVTGEGPIDFIAQNGIQVGFGASAKLSDNFISDNYYTPESYVACGILAVQAGPSKLVGNTFSGNEVNVCNGNGNNISKK